VPPLVARSRCFLLLAASTLATACDWVTVFVTESHVFCVEAGGDEDRFKGKALETVQKAGDSAIFG
jgi:hypothetical protein